MLHLVSQIDRGIKNKNREKKGPEAEYYRKIWKKYNVLRMITVWTYLLITLFEQPPWCITLEHNDYFIKYKDSAPYIEKYGKW